MRVFRTFNADAEPFREESERHDALSRRTRTIRTDALARVEGEGAMYVRIDDGEVDDVKLQDLRAAALLRGVPARPRVHRGARHHGADLRHLPGRLPDERRAGDGGRAAASRSTGRSARCGG